MAAYTVRNGEIKLNVLAYIGNLIVIEKDCFIVGGTV